jgi:hypothetical protein
MRLGSAIYLGASMALGLSHCSPFSQNRSSQQTVEIPQTQVRSQGRFGICWAYGTLGLVESHAKSKLNLNVDLSEEALAFWHMAQGLEAMFKTNSVPEILSLMARGSLPEGWNTRIEPEYETPLLPGEPRQNDALDLIQKFGSVPESVWSFKISNGEEKSKLFSAIIKNITKALGSGVVLGKLSLEEIMDTILVGNEAFPSVPPRRFVWEGKEYTSTQFTSEVLQFNPNDFGAFNAKGPEDLDRLIQVAKKALHQGLTVPIAFPININRIQGDRFTGSGITDPKDWVSFAIDGGHLVLITDYVNSGGKEGALDSDLALQELQKPSTDLDFFVVKNSWGLGAKLNENGSIVGDAPTGYYKMDLSYLLGASRVPQLTGNKYNNVQVVVPRSMLP